MHRYAMRTLRLRGVSTSEGCHFRDGCLNCQKSHHIYVHKGSHGSLSCLTVFVKTIAGRTDASCDNARPRGELSLYPRSAHSRC